MGEGGVESGGEEGQARERPRAGCACGGRDSRSFSQKPRPGNQGW